MCILANMDIFSMRNNLAFWRIPLVLFGLLVTWFSRPWGISTFESHIGLLYPNIFVKLFKKFKNVVHFRFPMECLSPICLNRLISEMRNLSEKYFSTCRFSLLNCFKKLRSDSLDVYFTPWREQHLLSCSYLWHIVEWICDTIGKWSGWIQRGVYCTSPSLLSPKS